MILVAQIIEKMNMGGIENLIMEYYRHVDRTKIQFDFITSERSKNIPDEEIRQLGGKIYKIPSYSHLFSYEKRLKQILKQGQYDIVQANLNTMCPFALFAAQQAGIPVRIAQNLSMAHRQEKKTILKELLRPFGKCFATHYMANGLQCGGWMFGEKAVHEGNVQIFKTVIDVHKNEYVPEIREKSRRQMGVANKVVIGHLARFVPQKNTLFVVDIFAEIVKKEPRAILLMIGDGELRKPAQLKAESLGLQDRILWLGYQKEIPPLYHAMDAFLLPSLYEGLPIVGVEAQMNGLPCFFSAEVTRETAICDLAHFVPLGNTPAQWADKILASIQLNEYRAGHAEEICIHGMDSEKEGARLTQYYIACKNQMTGN